MMPQTWEYKVLTRRRLAPPGLAVSAIGVVNEDTDIAAKLNDLATQDWELDTVELSQSQEAIDELWILKRPRRPQG